MSKYDRPMKVWQAAKWKTECRPEQKTWNCIRDQIDHRLPFHVCDQTYPEKQSFHNQEENWTWPQMTEKRQRISLIQKDNCCQGIPPWVGKVRQVSGWKDVKSARCCRHAFFAQILTTFQLVVRDPLWWLGDNSLRQEVHPAIQNGWNGPPTMWTSSCVANMARQEKRSMLMLEQSGKEWRKKDTSSQRWKPTKTNT